MIESRFRLSRYLLSARSRGWDYPASLLYALTRNTESLLESFR